MYTYMHELYCTYQRSIVCAVVSSITFACAVGGQRPSDPHCTPQPTVYGYADEPFLAMYADWHHSTAANA